jgi:hypothetical protein
MPAEILRLPTSTLFNLLPRVITRVRQGRRMRGLTTLGVDEERPRHHRPLLERLADPGTESAGRLGQLRQSLACIVAITHHCPQVTLVIHRFHLVKALNQAVDEVRKEQRRTLDTQGRKATNALRWLLSAQHALQTSDQGHAETAMTQSYSRRSLFGKPGWYSVTGVTAFFPCTLITDLA